MNKVTDINCLTGKQVVRDMNADELAQLEIDKASAQAQADAQAAREVARQEVLDRLGLSAAEVQLLLGA